MNISKLLGLILAVNGALIGINSVSIYHTNMVGLVIGGLIMLGGGYLILRDEF